MDPERLQELLSLIDRARQQGVPVEEINSDLASNEDLPFSSVSEVQAAFEGAQRGQREAQENQSAFADFTRLLSQGVAGEFLDEGAGLLAGAGAALVPGGDDFSEARARERARSRARTAEVQDRRGGFGTAARIAGGFLPGATALRGIRALRGGANASKGIGGLLTSGPKTTPTRTALRGATRLGTVGGLEGALFGAGREPGKIEQKAAAAADAAKVAAPLSAGLGLLGSATPAVKRALTRPQESGQRLAGVLRKEGQVAGKPSVVRQSIDAAKDRVQREGFGPLEETVKAVNTPAVRRALQSDDVAPIVEDFFPKVAAGEEAPSFLQLQKVKRKLSGLRQRAYVDGDSFDVSRFTDAEQRVVDAMKESVEGFPAVQKVWAKESARLRALEEGRKVARQSADDIGAALENLPQDRAVRDAFREGVAADIITNLEGGEAGVRSFVKNAKGNSQLRNKLIAVLGDADKADTFLARVEDEASIIKKADLARELVKAAGFLGLGTSLFGSAAIGTLE